MPETGVSSKLVVISSPGSTPPSSLVCSLLGRLASLQTWQICSTLAAFNLFHSSTSFRISATWCFHSVMRSLICVLSAFSASSSALSLRYSTRASSDRRTTSGTYILNNSLSLCSPSDSARVRFWVALRSARDHLFPCQLLLVHRDVQGVGHLLGTCSYTCFPLAC